MVLELLSIMHISYFFKMDKHIILFRFFCIVATTSTCQVISFVIQYAFASSKVKKP